MFKNLLAVLAIVLAPLSLSASQYGTAEEAEAMMANAEAVFDASGIDALITRVMDENDTEFRDRDLYVFVFDMNGITVAHGANPALVGRDLTGLQDPNGTAFIKEMMAVAAGPGRGWVDYMWANPQTKQLQAKSSLIVRLGDGHFAGVGIYKQ